jgi:hypothetical protein
MLRNLRSQLLSRSGLVPVLAAGTGAVLTLTLVRLHSLDRRLHGSSRNDSLHEQRSTSSRSVTDTLADMSRGG